MMDAVCQYEIYLVTCSMCGTKFQALVEPQEPHAKTIEGNYEYPTSGVKCPKCGKLAVFLGPVAHEVNITGRRGEKS